MGASILSTVLSNNYSVSDEREADKKGTNLLIKSGLNPCGVLNSMRKLYRMDGGQTDRIPDFMMDHPKTKQRIHYLKEYLKNKNIPIEEEHISYIYPKDLIGRISAVQYSDKEYKILNMKLSEGKKVNKGDEVYINYFVWDSKFENLISVSYGKATVRKTDSKEAELVFTENYTKSLGTITTDYTVSLTKTEK